MRLDEVLEKLKEFGDEKVRERNKKHGAGDNQYGVPLGKLRPIAKKIKSDHALSLELWKTDNADAMILATMIMDGSELSIEKIQEMILSQSYENIIREFTFNVVGNSKYLQELGNKWIDSDNITLARAGWNLKTAEVLKDKKDSKVDYNPILEVIESRLKNAPKAVQETMNRTLCEIGIKFDMYTDKCIGIGERIGRIDDRPVPKGCTSSYAPEWIPAGIRIRRSRCK